MNFIHVFSKTLKVLTILSITQSSLLFADNKTISRSENVFTKIEHAQMAQMGLTQSDWKKYKNILNGPRKFWSPNVHPMVLLGIEAKTAQERRKYARKVARMEYARIEKELAFDKAVQLAMVELYPNEVGFEYPNKAYAQKSLANRTDKIGNVAKVIIMYLPIDCATCIPLIKQSIENFKGIKIDIYIEGTTSKDAIRGWARKVNLSKELFTKGLMSLNFNNGHSNAFKLNKIESLKIIRVNVNGEFKVVR